MTPSILIVGSDAFASPLVQQLREFSDLAIQAASSLNEIEDRLQADPPDLLILDASCPESWELCRYVRQQRHLRWIYIALIDLRVLPEEANVSPQMDRIMGLTATGLEAGADTYLWLPALNETRERIAPMGIGSFDQAARLLQAQILAGQQRLQIHREITQVNDLLSSIALSDALTHLGNRRAFNWELARQVKISRAQSLPLALLMLDIDYFKVVNDQHGHLIGDQVLQQLSERLRHNMRFYETPFRYGGEEFAILLSNTLPEDAQLIAQRLCHLIGDHPFSVKSGLEIPITVSIGVAYLNDEDDLQGLSLLERADQLLLRAKSLGRNRVIFP